MAVHHARRWRAFPRVGLAALAALVAMTAFGVSAHVPGNHPGAAVRAMADDPPQEPWYNGCSSPFGNAPGGYDFTDACNWHDLCYGGHIANYNKLGCDTTFHQFMNTICYYNYGMTTGCLAWSNAYYAAVSLFGGPFYEGQDAEDDGTVELDVGSDDGTGGTGGGDLVEADYEDPIDA